MANYLIIASDILPLEGDPIPSPEVFDLMMKACCWEFPVSAPRLNLLKPGDRLVFYLGGKHARYFAGEAIIQDEFSEISKSSPVTFDRNVIPFFKWRLPLRNIERYPARAVGVGEVVSLSFARQRQVSRSNIGLLLKMGLRELTDEDVMHLRTCINEPAQG